MVLAVKKTPTVSLHKEAQETTQPFKSTEGATDLVQHPTDTFNSFPPPPPPCKEGRESEAEGKTSKNSTFESGTSSQATGKSEDEVDDNNNYIYRLSADGKTYYLDGKKEEQLHEKVCCFVPPKQPLPILQHHTQEKQEDGRQRLLEEEKEELLRQLEVASVSQQWTLHELRGTKEAVERMLEQFKPVQKEAGGGGKGVEDSKDGAKGEEDMGDRKVKEDGRDGRGKEVNRAILIGELGSLQNRIDELLQLHEEGLKLEDVSREERDIEGAKGGKGGKREVEKEGEEESLEYKAYLKRKVASLVQEKNLLAFKLKQVLEENCKMSGQLQEVEGVIAQAVELKKENELLIKDYEDFKKVKDEEGAEVDELVGLFKETLAENETLRAENEKMTARLAKEEGQGDGEVEEVRKENLKLMFQKVQLERMLKQQKQAGGKGGKEDRRDKDDKKNEKDNEGEKDKERGGDVFKETEEKVKVVEEEVVRGEADMKYDEVDQTAHGELLKKQTKEEQTELLGKMRKVLVL